MAGSVLPGGRHKAGGGGMGENGWGARGQQGGPCPFPGCCWLHGKFGQGVNKHTSGSWFIGKRGLLTSEVTFKLCMFSAVQLSL